MCSGPALSSNMDCWCTVQVRDENDQPGGFRDPAYFGTAFYCHNVTTMARIAETLGRKKESGNYQFTFPLA